MVDWTTLPADLVRRVGDCILATYDIDYYMVMRAVCHDWRSVTVDPQANGAASAVDPRFRPRGWVMLEEETPHGDDDVARLFLNVSTGRFLRRRVPQLRDHILVSATSDGLLVLGTKSYPHAARVLNPFTGTLLLFDAEILPMECPVMAAVTDDDPTKLFVFDCGSHHYPEVKCAEPTTQDFLDQGPFHLASMVAHAGDVYLASFDGEVIKIVGTVERGLNGELLADSTWDVVVVPARGQGDTESENFKDEFFLVDCSASEILLVRRTPQGVMEVFRVDVEKKDLQPVKSIGGRTLFVGYRCLCFDADMLPSVDGNCIYYYGVLPGCDGMYRYDLKDGREEKISGDLVRGSESYNARPFSIVQLLITYCNVLPDVVGQF